MLIFTTQCTCHKNKFDKSDIITYELNQGFLNEKDTYISDIADSIYYLKLETAPESYIVQISKLFFVNSKVIVFDKTSEKVFVFENSGKYLYQIGKQGKGPGEYAHISFISVDETNNHCYIIDGGKMQIHKFSLDGRFISSNENKIVINEIEHYKSGINVLFIAHKYFITSDSYNIVCTDSSMNVIKKSLPIFNRKSFDNTESVGRFNLYSYNNQVYLWDEFRNDTIYRINEALNFIPCYHLNYSLNKMPYEIRRTKQLRNDYIYMTKINDVFETKNFFFILGRKDRHEQCIVLNKLSSESYHLKPLQIWETRFLNNDGFIDNLDYGLPFWPLGYFTHDSNEYLFSYNDVSNIQQYLKSKEESMIKDGENENGGKLNNIISESKIDDNPILTIIRLK